MTTISGGAVGCECPHVARLQHQDPRLSSSSLGSTYSVMQSFHLQQNQKHTTTITTHQNQWGKEGIKGLEQSPEELAGY